MNRMMTIAAVLALAACDSATGTERGARDARPAGAREPGAGASFSGGTSHRAAIASVRARAVGTPSLYAARALVVDGGEVTLEVRMSTGAFVNLTSGSLVVSSTGTGEVNAEFQATTGNRYLIVAYPSTNEVVDAAHAHYIEFKL